jgi:feruloyl esterase
LHRSLSRSARELLATGGAALALAAALYGRTLGAALDRCERLTGLARPDLAINAAMTVPAGAYVPPSTPRDSVIVPDLCRVAATIKRRTDSHINVEVWMPADWNGKFQGLGNGGWSGMIPYAALAAAVSRGYAAAATDTGHAGTDGSFALGHPEQLVDFAFRAVHEMTVEAKAVVRTFYDRAPAHSYWAGCSSGGRQGLVEAQRFPGDYDGIIAGAPANAWTHLAVSTVWIAHATLLDRAGYLGPAKLTLLYEAALKACDASDGANDGVIEDPTRCRFDPRTLECRGDETPTCLTPAQVAAARKIYGGPRNPRTGESIFPGLEPGSELGWRELAGGPRIGSSADDHFKFVVFRNARWNFRAFDFDRDVALVDAIDDGLINATDPNLQAFAGGGGKLILYHGWADPLIAPRSTVDYYTRAAAALGGPDRSAAAVRLFMVPGMSHCTGGTGTSSFDMLTALEQWVERDRAPDRVPAARVRGGAVDRTRPLCPFPATARYAGGGSVDDAANFACTRP